MKIINVRRGNEPLTPLLIALIVTFCSFLLIHQEAVLAAQPSILPPNIVDGCPYLTQADASALLQEAVQTQAVGNLLFASATITAPQTAALCGYVNVAYRQDQTLLPSSLHLATQVDADHAVVVAKLLMGQQINLLPITDILRTATGKANAIQDSTLLQSLLWGGNVEGTIDYLYNLAQDEPKLHARRVGALGEIAVWFWLEMDEGNFAALIDGDGRDLNLIAALLGKDANEQRALDVATRLALQMEGRLARPTQTPAENECAFLSHATAMIMLNTSLPKTTDQGAGLCGYGGMAQKLAGQGPILTSDLPYGIASGVLEGAAAQQLFQRMADSLHHDNPVPNEDAYTTLQTSLAAGDLKAARFALYALTDQQRWRWGRAYGDYTEWLVKLTDDAEHIVFLTALRPDGKVGFIIARLKRERTASSAFQQIEKDNPDLINKAPRVTPEQSTTTQKATPTATVGSNNTPPTSPSTALPTATPAPASYHSMSTKDGNWTQILFDFNAVTVTAAIMFNESYYVATANDGMRVVRSDKRGGYEWYPLHASPAGLASDRVTALAIVEGTLWIGTADAGISIFTGQTNQWRTMNTRNSPLPSDTIHRIRPANPSNRPFISGAWISTSRGALEWDQGKVGLIFTTREGLPNANVWDVDTMLNPLGVDLYFATDAGILRREGLPVLLTPTDGDCVFDRATQLAIARNKAVWLVGEMKSQDGNGWEPQGLCQLSTGFLYSDWQAYTVANGRLPSNHVTALKMDDTGQLWASFAATGNDSGGVAFYDGSAWQRLNPPENELIQAPINLLLGVGRQLLFSHPNTDGLTIYTPAR